MRRAVRVVSQVGLVNIGFDCPEITVDIDARPSCSVYDWLQRRGRAARAFPAVAGDRSYQGAIISAARGWLARKRNPLLQAPCGAGKSYLAVLMAAAAWEKGKALGFLTVRRLLVGDLSGRLTAAGVPHGVIMPGFRDRGYRTKVASIDTVIARKLTLDVDCLVVDEAHQFMSDARLAALDRHAGIPRVLLSATPGRCDGRGLKRIADTLVLGPSTEELIDLGFLVPSRVYAPVRPDRQKLTVSGGEFLEPQIAGAMSGLTGDIIKEYLLRGEMLPAVVHACNVAHSRSIVQRFLDAGIEAVHIDSATPDINRREAFAGLRERARPKTTSLLIDCAGNTEHFGFPEDAREWTLEDQPQASSKPHPQALSVRRCPACWFCFRGSSSTCPGCGQKYVLTVREIAERKEALELKTRERKEAVMELYRERADDGKRVEKFAQYLAEAQLKGYKRGWAWGRYKGLFKEMPTEAIIKAAHERLRG